MGEQRNRRGHVPCGAAGLGLAHILSGGHSFRLRAQALRRDLDEAPRRIGAELGARDVGTDPRIHRITRIKTLGIACPPPSRLRRGRHAVHRSSHVTRGGPATAEPERPAAKPSHRTGRFAAGVARVPQRPGIPEVPEFCGSLPPHSDSSPKSGTPSPASRRHRSRCRCAPHPIPVPRPSTVRPPAPWLRRHVR